jgi:hypothetical protein
MNKRRKLGMIGGAAAAMLSAMVLTAGPASAAVDSMTADHVEITLFNNYPNAGGQMLEICNWQSSGNTFSIWVYDDDAGHNQWLMVNGQPTQRATVWVDAGICNAYTITAYPAAGDRWQGFFSNGSQSWGTNPVPFN